MANTVFKYWNGIAPGHINEILKPSLCRYSTRSQMSLDIPLWIANTGQQSLSFLGPEILFKIDTGIKNVKASSFLCMLLRKIFYFICKVIQIISTFLWSILSFDSLRATLFFLFIISILSSRSSYFNLIFPLIFTYNSRGTLTEISISRSFFRLSLPSEI